MRDLSKKLERGRFKGHVERSKGDNRLVITYSIEWNSKIDRYEIGSAGTIFLERILITFWSKPIGRGSIDFGIIVEKSLILAT